MFTRRLKIFLTIIFSLTLLLLGRAAQLQIVYGSRFRNQAVDSMKHVAYGETTRGKILDVRGVELAVDEPCLDVAVDYRAIDRDAEWIKKLAMERIKRDPLQVLGRSTGKSVKDKQLQEEVETINREIDAMWHLLAQVSGETPEQIEQTKENIRQRVQMRRRFIWYHKYQHALAVLEDREDDSWYRSWLSGEDEPPKLDDFSVTVEEQTQGHIIVRAIDDEVYNQLNKILPQCPGMELRRGKHRMYPLGPVGCHLLGHQSGVTREDVASDPNLNDELRRYRLNDQVGRSGIEAMCEQALRGTRGRIDSVSGKEDQTKVVDAEPGRDVHLTIDSKLQQEIEYAFAKERQTNPDQEHKDIFEHHKDLHGGAVVIDIATGQVRAPVSAPGFDLNQFDNNYARLVHDDLNTPLLNRATQAAHEPGSTVKPIIGIGAWTDGLIDKDFTVECTGFLRIGGVTYGYGRCWTARTGHPNINFSHHPFPYPHPTGFLTFTDAIDRSCNVFFETVANSLKMERIAFWFDQFGLGRKTGIGIEESAGRVPHPDKIAHENLSRFTWNVGIGQGPVAATPLQMANEAATIARNGIWLRPRLVSEDVAGYRQSSPPVPDRVDLHLNPAAVAAAREGMYRVANSESGTGNGMKGYPVKICAKTGSAQASPLTIPMRDAAGKQMLDEQGKPMFQLVKPDVYPWYHSVGEEHHLAHAWYIGYAPADHPTIAFAVMVEYGGAGGRVAGSVAFDVLEALREHGYLSTAGVGQAAATDSSR